MARTHSIKLTSNGAYWLARYYDTLGRRRGKVLGPKSELSRRQASVLCERLAVELQTQPGKAELGRAPTFAIWVETFFASKPDLGARARRAYALAAEKFKAFAGPTTRIDQVTPAVAGEFVTKLASDRDEKKLSPATVANYARHLRCLFNEAVHQRLLLSNPFARIRTQPKAFDRQWHYLQRETLTKILNQCPNDGWRCFLALQRIGALRKGESLAVTWDMVDLDRRLLHLPASITKTAKSRTLPLDPELFAVLLVAKPNPPQPTTSIVPIGDVDRTSDSNQHTRLRRILKRAGIKPWEDLFQTLRRNAIQDLRETLKDGWVVTAIAGHSEEVQRDFYLGHVRQTDVDRITGQTSEVEAREVMKLLEGMTRKERKEVLESLQSKERKENALPAHENSGGRPPKDLEQVTVRQQQSSRSRNG